MLLMIIETTVILIVTMVNIKRNGSNDVLLGSSAMTSCLGFRA